MISFHTCPLASEEGKETGGMNVYVLELSKELVRQGYAVDIFTRSQHKDNPNIVEISPNLRLIHLLGGPPAPVAKKSLLQYIPDFLKSYRSFTKKYNLAYDILHCHYYLSGLIGLAIQKESNKNVPIIMSFHTLALMKNLVARDELEREDLERVNAEILLTQKAKKIIAHSDSDKKYLEYLYNVDSKKIIMIPPGVDTLLFRPVNKNEAKKKIGANINDKIILFVGRIEPLKGLDALVYAIKIIVAKNPSLQPYLWIVGGDVSEKTSAWSKQLRELENLRRILNISMHVKFVGQRPQHELPFYYNASDIVALPSHYESFGMVALEAMACGVPVITSNVSGVSNFFDLKHPHITTVNNPLQLASQIEHILINSKIRAEIGKEVYEVAKNLNWQKVATQVSRVYQNSI